MNICKEYFGGDWIMFYYRVPWVIILRGIVDAPWFEDENKDGEDIEIDCDNLTDEQILSIENLAKK